MSKYRVGGLVPFDVLIRDPPDLFLTNEQIQEMTNLLKGILKEYEQNKLHQLRGGEGHIGDQVSVLRNDVPRSDGD